MNINWERLRPDYDEIRLERENEEIQQELEKYKNIVDKLERYICQEWYCFDNESVEFKVARDILNKLK